MHIHLYICIVSHYPRSNRFYDVYASFLKIGQCPCSCPGKDVYVREQCFRKTVRKISERHEASTRASTQRVDVRLSWTSRRPSTVVVVVVVVVDRRRSEVPSGPARPRATFLNAADDCDAAAADADDCDDAAAALPLASSATDGATQQPRSSQPPRRYRELLLLLLFFHKTTITVRSARRSARCSGERPSRLTHRSSSRRGAFASHNDTTGPDFAFSSGVGSRSRNGSPPTPVEV